MKLFKRRYRYPTLRHRYVILRHPSRESMVVIRRPKSLRWQCPSRASSSDRWATWEIIRQELPAGYQEPVTGTDVTTEVLCFVAGFTMPYPSRSDVRRVERRIWGR